MSTIKNGSSSGPHLSYSIDDPHFAMALRTYIFPVSAIRCEDCGAVDTSEQVDITAAALELSDQGWRIASDGDGNPIVVCIECYPIWSDDE